MPAGSDRFVVFTRASAGSREELRMWAADVVQRALGPGSRGFVSSELFSATGQDSPFASRSLPFDYLMVFSIDLGPEDFYAALEEGMKDGTFAGPSPAVEETSGTIWTPMTERHGVAAEAAAEAPYLFCTLTDPLDGHVGEVEDWYADAMPRVPAVDGFSSAQAFRRKGAESPLSGGAIDSTYLALYDVSCPGEQLYASMLEANSDGRLPGPSPGMTSITASVWERVEPRRFRG